MNDYGYQPGNELVSVGDTGSTRIRLALSTTTRGWDYDSTVEITVPTHDLGDADHAELVEKAATLQAQLRYIGANERDTRNQQDSLGQFAPPKAK